jgi:hypothetical protein
MGNIIGKPFAPWVKKQIETRQQALGKYSNVTEDIIKAYHTKAPFLRLASGIDVIEALQTTTTTKTTTNGITTTNINKTTTNLSDGAKDSLEFIGITGITGTAALARKCILQGGVLNENKLNNGLSSDGSLQGAYGWGGTDERGYIPMPGIIKADVKYLNNGALAQATVDIKCFSRKQFQIIDMLYMRPGYTVLLEWGHSTYLDNNNELKSFNTLFSQPLESLLNPGEKDQYKILDEITAEREKYNGNYDALLGKVAKFNWTFNQDGSYDITVYITGYGDVIESLKINIGGTDDSDENSETTDVPEPEETDPPIITNAKKTMMNRWLYNVYQSSQKSTPGWISRTFFDSAEIKITDSKIKNYPDPDKNYKPSEITIPNAVLKVEGAKTDDQTGKPVQTYIRLGYLLAWMETYIFLYNKKAEQKIPFTRFDMVFSDLDNLDRNYYLRVPYQFSSNPNICLINPIIPGENFNQYIEEKYTTTDDTDLSKFSRKTLYQNSKLWKALNKAMKDTIISDYIGKLSYIYINIEHIAKVLDALKADENNGIPLLDFLNQIFADINESLGGINKFTITPDIDTNTIKIYDDVPLKTEDLPDDVRPKKEDFTLIQAYGVKQDRGSFVRNLSLNAELSNNFATQVSIGAQASGNQPSGNATSFSTYNKGLWDRIIPSKVSSTSIVNESNEDQEKAKKQNEEIRKSLIDSLKEVYGDLKFKEDSVNNLKSPSSEFTQYVLGQITSTENPALKPLITAPFFIPFNLSITLDGISGIKLYEQFQINDEILPLSYSNDKIGVIIKGVNHSIDINGWITKLETQTSVLPETDSNPSSVSSPSPPSSNDLNIPQSSTSGNVSTQPSQGCGEKSIISIPPINLSNTNIRKLAMEKSYSSVFRQHGEASGMCSRWTYNLALNYTRILRNNQNIPGTQISAGGNANQNTAYFQGLVKLGYKQIKIASNITKAEIIDLVEKQIQYNYGDVIVYYANDGDGSHRQYGHTQIYVNESSASKWATSTKTNYGGNFIYKRKNSNCWDLYLFRAPIA